MSNRLTASGLRQLGDWDSDWLWIGRNWSDLKETNQATSGRGPCITRTYHCKLRKVELLKTRGLWYPSFHSSIISSFCYPSKSLTVIWWNPLIKPLISDVLLTQASEDGDASTNEPIESSDPNKPSPSTEVISEELQCPICLEMFNRATTLGCGHTFCAECLQTARAENNTKCPMCRTKITSVTHCVALDNIVQSLVPPTPPPLEPTPPPSEQPSSSKQQPSWRKRWPAPLPPPPRLP